MKDGNSKNRLGLAKWLTDKETRSPLGSRIVIGKPFLAGVSPTPPAISARREKWPTHPDLLNWLAADFIESDWNVKRAIRQLVTSATYRQSSVTTEEHMAKDPQNLYFARAHASASWENLCGTKPCMSADCSTKFGGPGVKPYQPAGLWNEVSLDRNRRFVQDTGNKIYRRSMYTYWKRSAPQPAMAAFDTPSPKSVPYNASAPIHRCNLVTLNDVQFVKPPLLCTACPTNRAERFPGQVNRAFELATGRPADDLRQQVMKKAYDKQKAVFDQNPAQADQLLAMGDSPREKSIDAKEHATWTVLASMILNLDETLNRE